MLSTNPLVSALSTSMLASLGTMLGAIAVCASAKISSRHQSPLLGFSAGVMLAASFLSLLIPALNDAGRPSAPDSVSTMTIVAALLAGATAIALFERQLPAKSMREVSKSAVKLTTETSWLLVLAIGLHNIPEGIVVGIGFARDNVDAAYALGVAIGIQNIPEGVAIALAILASSNSRLLAFGVGTLSGLVEPVGAFLGCVAASISAAFVPWAMSFAAGVMLYVVSGTIIPASHSSASRVGSSLAVIAGIATMVLLEASYFPGQ